MTGPGPTRPAGFGLGLALLMGGAACSEGCAHELPAASDAERRAPLELTELEDLLWRPGDAHYKLLAEPEHEALERLVSLLFTRAASGRLTIAQVRRAASDAAIAGVELHDVEVAHGGRVERLWVVVERPEDRRGRGAYVFRLGRLGGRGPGRIEYLLEAPHVRFDTHTGEVALGLFLAHEAEGPGPRALLLNSVHRYEQLDGSRGKLEPASDNPADAAHRSDHPLARVTARLLADHPVVLIQLHGFERDEASGEPDVIVSAGRKAPRPASLGITKRLDGALAELEARHFGDGIDRLGGTTNVQGRAAKQAGRCFVHVETSARVRARLRKDEAFRSRFAAALFGGAADEFQGGCR